MTAQQAEARSRDAKKLRARITRRELQIKHFTADAIRHGKQHQMFTWEADYHGWTAKQREPADRMGEAVTSIWASVAVIADKLAADRDALRRIEAPTLLERIKQAFIPYQVPPD